MMWLARQKSELEDGHRSTGAVDLDLGTVGDRLRRAGDRHDARDAELAADDHGVRDLRTDVDHDGSGGEEYA